jgi:predicted DNA-binding transcriptional regulator YafY
MRLVHTGRRWYLAAWDVDRDAWRTFRIDRLERQPRLTQGARFVPRQPPEDFATMVSRSIAASPYRYQVRLRVAGSVAEIRERVPPWAGVLEPDGSGHAVLTIGGDSAETIAAMIVHTGLEFTLLQPQDVLRPLQEIAGRLLRGTGASLV